MNSARITSFVICLGLACLLLTGNALAGTIKATEVTYATEVNVKDLVYTVPAGNKITWEQDVLRVAGSAGKFTLKGTLSGKAEFAGTGAQLPQVGDVTQTAGLPAGNIGPTAPGDVTLLTLAAGDTMVEWTITAQVDFTQKPTFSIDTSGWNIKDVVGVLGGGTITFTIATTDTNSGVPIGGGSGVDDWLLSKAGVKVSDAFVASSKTIDVGATPTPRSKFVNNSVTDGGATVGIDGAVAGILSEGGTQFTTTSSETIDFTISGDLSGIKEISWLGSKVTKTLDDADRAGTSVVLAVPGNQANITGGVKTNLEIVVDGTTVLQERTLAITVILNRAGTLTDITLVASTQMTQWTFNGTVMLANFQNGNTNVFASRMYIFNPSTTAGAISARVWNLPVAGGTETFLGSVPSSSLGSLGAMAGRNIKLYEDIIGMNGLGMTLAELLAATSNSGNVVVEITVEATGVTGVAQVYNPVTLQSFGIFPMAQ